MLQIRKPGSSAQAFSAAPAGMPTHPQNSVHLEVGCSQRWCRWILSPSSCKEETKSPTTETTENSLEPGSHFHSKCCDVNTMSTNLVMFITNKASEEEAHGCSPRESPGENFSAWPPSPASLSEDQCCSWFSPVGRVGSTLEACVTPFKH